MLEIARENGITVVRDPILADILSDEEVGSFIPVETWEAVAALFAFVERGRVEKWF
jgi:type III secretion system FlhB-like substrate exporter